MTFTYNAKEPCTWVLQEGFLGWLRYWSSLGSRQWEGRRWAKAELRTVERGALYGQRGKFTLREVGMSAGGED